MLVTIINELNRLFGAFNEKYFENKLEVPVITIQTAGRKPTRGWCTCAKVWVEGEAKFYEINVTPEYLNRTPEEICATLIHEMVHLYNLMLDIKDTSNNMIYHNKRFKVEAEKRGLIIAKDDTVGWSLTSLQETTKMFISTLGIDEALFKLSREKQVKARVENKNKLYNYECPCGKEKRIKSKLTELNVKCEDCGDYYALLEV